MKKAVQILILSAFLLTFMLTKTLNVMQDTEIWKPIPGLNAEASSEGRIKSYYSDPFGRIIKPQKGLKGKYYRIQLQNNKKTYSVHRLVAMAWHDNPNNYPVIRHLDDNGLNNRPSNLQWDTQKNNIRFGRRGINKPYPPIMRTVIKEAFKAGFSKLSISNYFKITDTAVRRVVNE